MTEIVGTVDSTEVVVGSVFAMPTYVTVENGSITTAKLADGAVTSAKLDPSLRMTALTNAEIDEITGGTNG